MTADASASPAPSDASVIVRKLGLRYPGNPAPTLADVSLTIRRGELACIVGPSGAGKTSLLHCIAGLTAPTAGSVEVSGRVVDAPPASLAVVFQDYSRSLFPWMSTLDNVALPLTGRRLRRRERRRLALHALERVGIASHARKYPWEMSGGMQQRAAIARALVQQPDVLVMDEQMASVDAQTRADLEDLVLNVWDGGLMTVLLVTHDIDEAAYLGQRILVLSTPPSTVVADHPVHLPYPRDQVGTKSSEAFIALRSTVLEEISTLRRRQQEREGPPT